MNWNDQDIALLAKLWAAGLSTRQIGHRLHYSNGAICGKINRLGLKRGDVPAAKPVIVAPVPVPHPVPRKRLDFTKPQLREMLAQAVRNTV